MRNNAVETNAANATNAAYSQLIALRKQGVTPADCVAMAVDSLMEKFGFSRRRAALKVTAAWYDLEAAGAKSAYIDVSLTTGNAVVIHDTATGRTSIFSVRELLRLRDQVASSVTINA